jgi:hypothetical protein
MFRSLNSMIESLNLERTSSLPHVPSPIWRQLPIEVIIKTLPFMNVQSLYSICLVSKALGKAAEQWLYSRIDLSSCPIRCVLLFRTLLLKPVLASYICTLVPADSPDSIGVSEYHELGSRVLRRIFRGGHNEFQWDELPVIRALIYKQLRDRVDSECIIKYSKNIQVLYTPGFMTIESTLPSVRKFRMLYSWVRRALSADFGKIASMLENIPNVTHLEMPLDSGYAKPETIRISLAPPLEDLACPIPIASILVPNRPVRRLILSFNYTTGEDDMERFIPNLAKGTVPVEELGLLYGREWNTRAKPDVIEKILRVLTAVRVLHLYLNFWKGDLDDVREFMATVSCVSYRFHHVPLIFASD